MAVYNGDRFVADAIRSILAQTFSDFEFLIVDDGSTDETAAELAAFHDPRIRVIRNEVNIGLTKSLNLGLRQARGSLVARQDADDRSHPGRLAAQVGFLDREPDVIVLGTQGRYIDARGRPRSAAPWPKSTSSLAIRWSLLFDGPFIHSSVMLRRAIVWNEFGGYDETLAASQDFELWTRLSAAGCRMRNLPSALVDFRIHPGSVTTRYSLERIAKLRPVFLRALIHELGEESVPAGWPDTWFQANFPGALAASPEAVAAVAQAIERIHGRFVEVHPAAASDMEIRRHRGAMLIRLANYAADNGQPRSLALLAKAFRLDAGLAVRAFPRYIGYLARRRSRAHSVAARQ